MFENCALHNARLPRGRWLALLFVGGVMILLLIQSLPQSMLGDIAGAALASVVSAILFGVVGVVVFEHLATARTLRLGNPLNAMVAHTRRSVWGMGTSGQTWHVTLRYEIAGRTIESKRSVPEEVYRRCHAGSQVEVRVLPGSPARWAMPERATKQSVAPVLSAEQRRAQMPGVVAFTLLAVSLVAAAITLGSSWTMITGLFAFAAAHTAVQWRRGEGQLRGMLLLVILPIYLGTPILIMLLSDAKENAKGSMTAPGWIAIAAVGVAVIIGWITVFSARTDKLSMLE